MVQILNISQVRNRLSNIVQSVAREGKNVVIVRDSLPEAVIIPYDQFEKNEEEVRKIWQLRFDRLMKDGKKLGKEWAKRQNIKLNKLTEEEKYALVKKA